MRLTIIQYYLLVLAALSAFMMNIDFQIGMRYVMFWFLNCTMLYFVRGIHRRILLVFFGTMFLSYFLRGAVVSSDYSLFTFDHMYAIDFNLVLATFDSAIITSFFFSLGVLFTSFRFTRFKRPQTHTDTRFNLLQYFWIIVFILFSLMLLKIGLVEFAGVGRKGFENQTSLAFLLRFIPLDLPFLVMGLLVFKYWKTLDFIKRSTLLLLLFGFSFSVLLTGSKSFVMVFGLCYGIYLLYGKFRLKLLQFAILVAIGAVVTSASFAVAKAIKVSYLLPHLSTEQVLAEGFNRMLDEDLILILNEVSARFNGFDGQLKYLGLLQPNEYKNLEQLELSFHPVQITMNFLEGLIPKVELTSVPPCGSAVGTFAEKFPPDKPYAGAVGISAATRLTGKSAYWLLTLFLGMVIGLCTKLLFYIKNKDLQFILFFFHAYFVMNLTMSGNFDTILVGHALKIILLTAFSFLMLELGVLMRRGRRNRWNTPVYA